MTHFNSTLLKVTKVYCKHCSYIWFSKSKKLYISCPNCHYKINVTKARLNGLIEDVTV